VHYIISLLFESGGDPAGWVTNYAVMVVGADARVVTLQHAVWSLAHANMRALRAQGSVLQYDPPTSRAHQPEWLKGLKDDRDSTLANIGFKGGVFDVPELKWTQTSWIQPQMHPYPQ
jgi:hypothetical protein